MNGLILWYNANRSKIWGVIGAFAIIIITINLLNSIAHKQLNSQNKKESDTSVNLMNTISMDNDESTVSGDKIPKNQKERLKTLDEFANYCSIGDVDKAYSLLSEECKEEMYPTKDVFEISYYSQIFGGSKKIISAENWVENIYKVKYMEDALSTGVFDEENTIQDYITIVVDADGNTKLNINGFIRREKIDEVEEQDNLKIRVVETNVYMDFQTYTYEIVNNSDKAIILNDPNLDDTMYIEDKVKTRYQAYTHEIAPSELKVSSKEKKDLTIKYYNRYSSNKIIKNIVFSRIILDYGAYSNYQNLGYYSNYGEIQIEL